MGAVSIGSWVTIYRRNRPTEFGTVLLNMLINDAGQKTARLTSKI